jgi:hypothetical protein
VTRRMKNAAWILGDGGSGALGRLSTPTILPACFPFHSEGNPSAGDLPRCFAGRLRRRGRAGLPPGEVAMRRIGRWVIGIGWMLILGCRAGTPAPIPTGPPPFVLPSRLPRRQPARAGPRRPPRPHSLTRPAGPGRRRGGPEGSCAG